MSSRTILSSPFGSESNNVAAMNDMQFIASLDDLVQGNAVSQAGRATNRWQGSSLANLDSLTSSNPPSQLSNEHSSLMMMDMPESHASSSSDNHPSLNLASMIASANAGATHLPAAGHFGAASSNTASTAMPQVAASSSSLSKCLPPPPIRPTSTKLAPTLERSSDVSVIAGKKRPRDVTEVSENEDEGSRRRQDRNVREQQRSQQITGQISGLKQVLEEANIQFKPDKHSTLVSVVDYVKQLQERSRMLEGEHEKLQDTITKTAEMVNSQNQAASADPSVPVSNDLLTDGNPTSPFEEDSMVLVEGLDYRAVFGSCLLACSIASVDGRFLDCNKQFEDVTGYNRRELFPSEDGNDSESDLSVSDSGEKETKVKAVKNQSFFNILNQDDMREVFGAMSDMLRRSVVSGSKAPEICQEDTWSGFVLIGRFEKKKVCLLFATRRMNLLMCALRNISLILPLSLFTHSRSNSPSVLYEPTTPVLVSSTAISSVE
jgi:PAS domain-containing protein